MNSYEQLSPFVFNCNVCPTPCNGVSKMSYIFDNDASFSENYEQKLIDFINSNTQFKAQKCNIKGYPDVEIVAKNGFVFYIEVKVQQRTFMGVEKIIPLSGLKPSETIALNLSDLKRYFEIENQHKIPIFIFWVLLNRPCITNTKKVQFYYRLVTDLKTIYQKQLDKRRFRRKSGDGDVVDGVHKGVTVNYHFSLTELIKWDGSLI